MAIALNFLRSIENRFCTICYEEIEDNQEIIGHGPHPFHFACLKDWLKISPDCPMCRKDFSLESIREIFQKVGTRGADLKKKWGLLISGMGAFLSISSTLSAASAPSLTGLFVISLLAVQNEHDRVKKAAITITSLATGALGSYMGLENEAVLLSGLFGASCSQFALETKEYFEFWTD